MFIHIRCIFQQFKKSIIIVHISLFITGYQRPHLKQNHLMIFINGKFYIQGQSIHDVFQFTHSPQKFPPGCFQCAFIHIPDHFHHPARRSTGNAVGGSCLIIIDQIIRFIALNISGKHYTTADHMERLTLNQHLFI